MAEATLACQEVDGGLDSPGAAVLRKLPAAPLPSSNSPAAAAPTADPNVGLAEAVWLKSLEKKLEEEDISTEASETAGG
eukprot:2523357-Prymnesium_polylepis.1